MRRTLCTLASALLTLPALAGPTIKVKFTPEARATPASGRLIVLLKDVNSSVPRETEPLDGPFWEAGQPILATDLRGIKPDSWVELGGGIEGYPTPLAELPAGTYEVQARLDTVREDSNWRRQSGNLYTKARATLTLEKTGGDGSVDLVLDAATVEPPREPAPGLEWFSVRSELLSKFRGRDVVLRAGVAFPADYDPARMYAAVYEVPGFGGDDRSAAGRAAARRAGSASELDRSAFWIVLNPEGPNGHTLFADSANNGPCGRALIEELIPALEKKLPLIAKPEARLLRGHSSGGWSVLWLATEYAGTFGACWSSSPDPVDFRRFQSVDIYADPQMYLAPTKIDRRGRPTPMWERLSRIPAGLMPVTGREDGEAVVSYRRGGAPVMAAEREMRGEDILGPDNSSGQQWDSWFAVFGPRSAAGRPSPLVEPVSGAVDHRVAAEYRKYDISARLRADPGRFVPIFKGRIRLVVGDADNFFLNEATALLKHDLESLAEYKSTPAGPGYITIVPGLDHGSIFESKELRGFETEMAGHLRAAGLAR